MSRWTIVACKKLKILWLLAMTIVLVSILLSAIPLLIKGLLTTAAVVVTVNDLLKPSGSGTLQYQRSSRQWLWQEQNITILPETFLASWVIVLSFQLNKRRLRRIITPKTLSPEAYRQLLVELKINGLRLEP